jgi:hypothetical protein
MIISERLYLIFLLSQPYMQTKIDWTTGGLTFYDVDPPKSEKKEDFTPDYDVNIQFDPIPSS